MSAPQAVMHRALPAGTFEPCEKSAVHVSSTSFVRYRMNDYSAPTTYGFREVIVKGFVGEVVIFIGSDEIARHRRSYERGGFVCDPLHCLALIEQKPGVLDQAAPLADWQLPRQFADLRRLLEVRMGNRGKREFVQVLRLLEPFPQSTVAAAVSDAIRIGALRPTENASVHPGVRAGAQALPHNPRNNEKIRPQPDRENAFAGTSGGGDGPDIQPSPL